MSRQEPYSDAWLDRQLRAVAPPDGLVERLRGIPSGGDAVDAALRDVRLPPALLRRLRRIPYEGSWYARPRPRRFDVLMRGWVAAAALFLAVGLAWLAPFALFLAGRVNEAERDKATLAQRLPAEATTPVAALSVGMDEVALETAEPPPVRSAPPPKPLALRSVVEDRRLATSQERMPRAWTSADGRTAARAVDPLLDPSAGRWPDVQAHQAFDELPELRKLPAPAPQGLHAPLAPGFDLAFFLRSGVHPFVAPLHAKTQAIMAPLAARASSFALALRYAADGAAPPPRSVRTEGFLAAMDYRFPRPKPNELVALAVSGGPSPVGGEGLRLLHGGDSLKLLQFGVQAADVARRQRGPINLTLAVDVSASMAWEGRLDAVRRALERLPEQLAAADRLALVAFHERAEVLLEDVGPADAETWHAAVARLRPHGATNLGAGLSQAYAVARRAEEARQAPRRVALLTDGLAELDAASLALLEGRLLDAASRGVRLDVIDLRPEADLGDLAPQLDRFAAAGQGRVHRAMYADEVRWALAEIITGQSQLVARDVRLRVKFNPLSVLEYRLFGHEAADVAGMLPARAECDFRSGQTASVLFELRLFPKGVEELGQVELEWRDPNSGKTGQIVRKIARSQLAPTFEQASGDLQTAALAAEVAEVLRESPFARSGPNPGSLTRARELLGQADSRLSGRPSLAALEELVRQLEKPRPAPRGRR